MSAKDVSVAFCLVMHRRFASLHPTCSCHADIGVVLRQPVRYTPRLIPMDPSPLGGMGNGMPIAPRSHVIAGTRSRVWCPSPLTNCRNQQYGHQQQQYGGYPQQQQGYGQQGYGQQQGGYYPPPPQVRPD
jgi:hypothetical protein